MLGWVVYSDHILIRKDTKERMRRVFADAKHKLDRLEPLDRHEFGAIQSYVGSLKWYDSYNLC